MDTRFKGATYQRRGNSTPTREKQYKPKVTNPPIVIDSKLEMGDWLNNVKVLGIDLEVSQRWKPL